MAPHDDVPEECANEAILEQLAQRDWPRLTRELALYAAKQVKVRYWGRDGHAGRLPKGLQADDLATVAILQVYRGKRRWDPDQDPDLLDYLRGVVDSLISSLVHSRDHRVSKERVDVDDVELPDSEHATPEESLLEAERMEIGGRLLDGLLKLAENDTLVKRLLDQLFDGEGRPKVIAEKLKCDVDDIYNAKKRLDRMVN